MENDPRLDMTLGQCYLKKTKKLTRYERSRPEAGPKVETELVWVRGNIGKWRRSKLTGDK